MAAVDAGLFSLAAVLSKRMHDKIRLLIAAPGALDKVAHTIGWDGVDCRGQRAVSSLAQMTCSS